MKLSRDLKLIGKIEGTKGFWGGKRFLATLTAVDPRSNFQITLWQKKFRRIEKAEHRLDREAELWSRSLKEPEVLVKKEYPHGKAVQVERPRSDQPREDHRTEPVLHGNRGRGRPGHPGSGPGEATD